jgi:hypothetical protein
MVQSFVFRSRRALAMTDTELKLMAAPAMMGLSSQPKYAYPWVLPGFSAELAARPWARNSFRQK